MPYFLSNAISEKVHFLRSNFLCALAIVFFAMGFPALDQLLKAWGIISVATVRNCLAFLLIFSIWVAFEGYQKVFSANWKLGFWIGAAGFGSGSLLLIIAQNLTTAVVAALAAALMPIAGVALEILLDKRKINFWFLVGMFLVLLGGLFSIGSELHSLEFGIGLLVAMFSVSAFAWGSRATVKNIPNKTTLEQTVVTTFGMACFSIFIYVICFYLKLPYTEIPTVTPKGLLYLLIYSWIALGISQILWIRGVYDLGIGVASFHLNVAPFYVMLILFIVGKDWVWLQAIGAMIIIFGVVISQKKSGKFL